MEQWATVAAPYYMSMRRYDDVLSVLAEFRRSGEETFPIENSVTIAECYKQKGDIDSAVHLLQGLIDSAAEDRYWLIAQLASVEAIGAKDLTGVLDELERARAEVKVLPDWLTEQLLLLQYACGRKEDAAKSLEHLGESLRYRRAQIAQATRSNSAGIYLEQAILWLKRLSLGGGNSSAVVMGQCSARFAMALARAGRPDEARKEIERAIKLEPEQEDIAYHTACAYSLLGDTTLALQWLQTAVDRGHLELWWAKVDPDLDPLRNLPRFKAIMTDWDNRIKAMLAQSGSGK
jgi:tetratricopeptide (TPR) repeat protein